MIRRKVLVTGGAGFIGAHTALELFQAGFEPVLIDNFSRCDRTLLNGLQELMGQPPSFIEGDCGDTAFLRSVFQNHSITAVLHFAAFKSVGESVESPLLYYRNNLGSLIAVLEVMKEFRVTDFIFSSSCTVYGQPDRIPVAETAPFKQAESPYGATKQQCERILQDVFPTGFRIISLRYFNPIGAHPSALLGELPIGVPSNLIPYITQTAIGKRKKLVVFGNDYNTPDGSNIRDFIHVVDLAQAHVQALEYLLALPTGNYYDVFNLGTGKGVSVLELLSVFQQVANLKLNYEIGPRRPGDVEKTYADPSKALNVLGWRTKRTVEEALADAWRWEKRLGENKKS